MPDGILRCRDLTMAKMVRKYKNWTGVRSPRSQSLASASSSTSFRRLLSSGRSLTRGPCLNGIKPLLSSSDGGDSDSLEALKTVQAKLGSLIDGQSELDNKSTSSKGLQEVRTFCQTNVPQLAQIFDKFGGAANGQVASVRSRTDGNGVYQEVATILKDVGHAHWVGAILVFLGLTLDRCSKATERSAKLVKHMENLRSLGKQILEFHGLEQDFRDSEPSENVKEVVRLLSEHMAYCDHEMRSKFLTKCFFADTDEAKLVRMEADIGQLYQKLMLTTLLRSNHSDQTGETFELTDDTVMVGGEKRVDEALQEVENYNNATGVHALILSGKLGSGKSTVGLELASKLKEKKNIDKLQCCKIAMRGKSDIKVTEKQEELYRKLHKGAVKKFPENEDGRRELQKLFRNQLQAGPLLLLFDDADRVQDLKELLPDNLNSMLPPGTILLVTTRNSGVISVLEEKGVDCRSYEVKELEEREAKALLLTKIFGDHDVLYDLPVARHLMQSKSFLKLLFFCDGVPLAISVVGSSVWRRGQEFLREDFPDKSLRNLPLETVYTKLNSDRRGKFLLALTTAMNHAYESLSTGDPISTEQEPLRRSLDFAYKQLKRSRRHRDVFLDIVALHLGRKWSDVERICGAELAELKQLSMVQRLAYKGATSGMHDPIVQVHNLLVGVSRKLEYKKSPDRRVVVENVNRLPKCFRDDQGPEVYNRVELLKVDHCKEVCTAVQLDRLTSLRYLELHGTTIQGKCKKVPSDLTYYRSRQSSLPFALPDLQSLVVLDVDFRMDATLDMEVIQSMPNLQKLKVENSCSLKSLGSGLKNVRIVVIVNCPHFESLGSFDSAVVEHLEIVDCPKYSDFSSVSKLIRLERLALAGLKCQPPTNLPTRKPTLIGKFREEPTEFTKFSGELVIPSGVQTLDLSRNSNLKELPTFAPNNRIKKVNLRFCSALARVEMKQLTNLEYLNVGGCSVLERVPSLPKSHAKLKVLDVQGCEKLDRLKLWQSVEVMKARNPEFRLIGLPLTDEDDRPRGGCPSLQRCMRFSFKNTRSLIEKVKLDSPHRSLRTCWTFPQRSKPKYR